MDVVMILPSLVLYSKDNNTLHIGSCSKAIIDRESQGLHP